MKAAVISDIHANLEAFKSVLSDIDKLGISSIACLGDNVGYGPEPEAVVDLVRARHIPCVMGNHELVLTKARHLSRMNPSARKSAVMTRDLVSDRTMDYMRSLKPTLHFHGALCVHGCPPDSITTYLMMLSEADLVDVFRSYDEAVCFVGHTHDLECISFDGHQVTRHPLGRTPIDLKPDRRYIINAGSVGQPRDGDNRAKYLVWDPADHSVRTRFVPYDIAKTAERIVQLGLPEYNATRLW